MVKDKVELNDRVDFWNKSVLYIHPIHGGTYKVISQGIIEGLRNLVRKVYTGKAEQDEANLAVLIGRGKRSIERIILINPMSWKMHF